MGRIYKTWGGTTARLSRDPSLNKVTPRSWGGVTVTSSNNQAAAIQKQIDAENKALQKTNTFTVPIEQVKQTPIKAQQLAPNKNTFTVPIEQINYKPISSLNENNKYVSRDSLKGKQISGAGVIDSPNIIKVDKTGAAYMFRGKDRAKVS